MLEKIRGAVQARYGEIMSTIETLSTIDRAAAMFGSKADSRFLEQKT